MFLPVVMRSQATSAMQARSSGLAGCPLGGGPGEVSALDDLGQPAEQLPRPELPSDEMVRRHSLTHTPYADWCRYCVIGRGQESHHRRSQNEIDDATPVLALDYCFLGTEEAAAAASSSSTAVASTARRNSEHNIRSCDVLGDTRLAFLVLWREPCTDQGSSSLCGGLPVFVHGRGRLPANSVADRRRASHRGVGPCSHQGQE